jgi:hypothetical protein
MAAEQPVINVDAVHHLNVLRVVRRTEQVVEEEEVELKHKAAGILVVSWRRKGGRIDPCVLLGIKNSLRKSNKKGTPYLASFSGKINKEGTETVVETALRELEEECSDAKLVQFVKEVLLSGKCPSELILNNAVREWLLMDPERRTAKNDQGQNVIPEPFYAAVIAVFCPWIELFGQVDQNMKSHFASLSAEDQRQAEMSGAQWVSLDKMFSLLPGFDLEKLIAFVNKSRPDQESDPNKPVGFAEVFLGQGDLKVPVVPMHHEEEEHDEEEGQLQLEEDLVDKLVSFSIDPPVARTLVLGSAALWESCTRASKDEIVYV